jgi:spore coat polysaccharide biosynthesis protein SpsF
VSRIVAVVTARMASARYPGKALAPLAGRPLLAVLLERIATARGLDGFVFATSKNPENVPLLELAAGVGWETFAGDEDDVLRRHIECALQVGADHVVRITGDNPLTDLETLEMLVALHRREEPDYTYVPGDALLMGILSEVISVTALTRAWDRGEPRHRSELVTMFIKEHPEEFRILPAALPEGLYRPEYRLTVDEAEDVALMQALFERLDAPGHVVSTREALLLLDREPSLPRLNAHLRHRAANFRSVALDAAIQAGSRTVPGDRP